MKLFHLQDWFQTIRARRRQRQTQPSGVLLISSGGLGDTVLFSYVVENFIALAKPNERVVLLCNQGSDKMGFLFPPVVEILSIDFQRLRKNLFYRRSTMTSLFEANFRLVIHTDHLRHPDMDEALARACVAAEAIAMTPRYMAKYSRKIKVNSKIYDRLYDSGLARKDKVRRWIEFANWLSPSTSQLQALHLSKDRIPPISREPKPLVVIHPYSAIKEKQFPPSLYKKICAAIPQCYEIAITGTKSDRARNPEFEPLIKSSRVCFEDASFQVLASRLRAAKLVISVDTACMHLAVAVGAPTLCLASAAYVGEIVPYDATLSPSNVQFVYKTMDCQGCLGDCHLPAVRGMYPCVAQLTEEVILKQIRNRLKTIQPPANSSVLP